MSHSQISRSQLALKKRNQPTATQIIIDVDHQNGTKARKSHTNNGSSNGATKKHGNDEDVIILDNYETPNVLSQLGPVEEVVTEEVPTLLPPAPPVVEDSPSKKRNRSRKSKDSVDSKDSDSKKLSTVENPKARVVVEPSPIVVIEPLPIVVIEPLPVAATETPIEKETKVLQLTTETLSEKKRRSDRLQNASTIVNLSSISEQSTKIMADETIETPTSISERRISGRRSTRPLDDFKFTYRTPIQNDTLNASINATVGSEINDSLLTPAADRKRRVNDGSMDSIDSPKRSRLDLTGLFSSLASPVSMLRNRFRRTNLASTPVVGDIAPLDTSAELLDASNDEAQMKEIDLNEKSDNENVVDIIDGDDIPAPADEPKPTVAKKSKCVIM